MPKKQYPSVKKVNVLYNKTYAEAIASVERLARQHLKENPEYAEFVMGMGCAMFVTQNDDYVSVEDSTAEELTALFDEFDRCLHMTGDPMRFTADGPKRTNW